MKMKKPKTLEDFLISDGIGTFTSPEKERRIVLAKRVAKATIEVLKDNVLIEDDWQFDEFKKQWLEEK